MPVELEIVLKIVLPLTPSPSLPEGIIFIPSGSEGLGVVKMKPILVQSFSQPVLNRIESYF